MYRQKGLLLLYSCFNMRRQLNRFISGGNLSQGEYLVLRNIRLSNKESKGDGREGTLKAADLSDMLELSRPSITRILNALENRGYITRSIDPKDRRSIRMELTDAGNEAFDLANRRIADTAGDMDIALFSVYKALPSNNGCAEHLAYGLMTEADSEDRNLTLHPVDDLFAYAGVLRIARTGRQDNMGRRHVFHLFGSTFIVSDDANIRTDCSCKMYQIVSKAVVVIND
jgi:DNA-binding MarR family transcriptional regulator